MRRNPLVLGLALLAGLVIGGASAFGAPPANPPLPKEVLDYLATLGTPAQAHADGHESLQVETPLGTFNSGGESNKFLKLTKKPEFREKYVITATTAGAYGIGKPGNDQPYVYYVEYKDGKLTTGIPDPTPGFGGYVYAGKVGSQGFFVAVKK